MPLTPQDRTNLRRRTANRIVQCMERTHGQAAPSELLHLAADLIEHVAYNSAGQRSTEDVVLLLRQAMVTENAADLWRFGPPLPAQN